MESEKQASEAGAFEELEAEDVEALEKIAARTRTLELAGAKHKKQKMEVGVSLCSEGSQQPSKVDAEEKQIVPLCNSEEADCAAGGVGR